MNARKNTEKITVPKQKRSMDTKKTLKSTAKRLFSEKGYHNTSSNEIAKAASVSIGTFYNYYNDKKEVFIELLHDYCNGIISHIKICPIGDADDIISLIGEYIENVMNAHDASKGFHCEMVSLIYTDIQIREIMDGYEKAAMINIEDILRLNESHLKIKDFKSASFIIYKSVEEVIHSIKIFDTDYDHAKLMRELVQMICSYLL